MCWVKETSSATSSDKWRQVIWLVEIKCTAAFDKTYLTLINNPTWTLPPPLPLAPAGSLSGSLWQTFWSHMWKRQLKDKVKVVVKVGYRYNIRAKDISSICHLLQMHNSLLLLPCKQGTVTIFSHKNLSSATNKNTTVSDTRVPL